jgi:hypothetical protein
MYNAVADVEDENPAFQQLAVSHAAHNALTWIFHGSRLSPYIDNALKTIQTQILANGHVADLDGASSVGRKAAFEVITARTNDGIIEFVDYNYGPQNPGIYQLTNPSYGLPPDGPQIPFTRMFSNAEAATTYLAPAPPEVTDPAYEEFLAAVKSIGFVNSTTRTQDQTDIALFWEESAPM